MKRPRRWYDSQQSGLGSEFVAMVDEERSAHAKKRLVSPLRPRLRNKADNAIFGQFSGVPAGRAHFPYRDLTIGWGGDLRAADIQR